MREWATCVLGLDRGVCMRAREYSGCLFDMIYLVQFILFVLAGKALSSFSYNSYYVTFKYVQTWFMKSVFKSNINSLSMLVMF